MQIIYVDTRYKPKRKSRKKVVKISKAPLPEFRPLQFAMPAAYRPNDLPSLNSGLTAPAARVEPQSYSGERKLLGIGVLHKSCLQPIFSETEAVEIAHMRR